MEIEKVSIEIEKLRDILNGLCANLGDEKYNRKILNISRKLDDLIVKYTILEKR